MSYSYIMYSSSLQFSTEFSVFYRKNRGTSQHVANQPECLLLNFFKSATPPPQNCTTENAGQWDQRKTIYMWRRQPTKTVKTEESQFYQWPCPPTCERAGNVVSLGQNPPMGEQIDTTFNQFNWNRCSLMSHFVIPSRDLLLLVSNTWIHVVSLRLQIFLSLIYWPIQLLDKQIQC